MSELKPGYLGYLMAAHFRMSHTRQGGYKTSSYYTNLRELASKVPEIEWELIPTGKNYMQEFIDGGYFPEYTNSGNNGFAYHIECALSRSSHEYPEGREFAEVFSLMAARNRWETRGE
ncbi:MAG: hypothetical protein ACRDZY_00105 [Acidimicrobiales bacterium]